MSFRVTHYVRRTAGKEAWIPLTFLTRAVGSSESGPYFLGFETFRPISLEEVKSRQVNDTVKMLEWPHKIEPGQALWLSPAYDVWLASEADPIGDPAKLLLERGNFAFPTAHDILKIASDRWLKSHVIKEVFLSQEFKWLLGDYLNSKEAPHTLYHPQWQRRLRVLALERLRELASRLKLDIQIKEHHLQEQEHRYDHIERLIADRNITLPLEVIFETSARQRAVKVVQLANVEHLALLYNVRGTAARQIELRGEELYDGGGDWLRPIRESDLLVCVPTYQAPDHFITDAIAFDRLRPKQKTQEPTIDRLAAWIVDNQDNGLIVCDMGVAYQIQARLRDKVEFGLATYDQPIPVGIAYKESDAEWGQLLEALVREVLSSGDERVAASVGETVSRCRALGLTWVQDLGNAA